MEQFSITITAEMVAWYAAVVSTIGLIFTGLAAWRDRARLSISISSNMRVLNVPRYD